jgi:hypothetical protein
LFGQAFALYGLPRLGLQLERGSWEANLIRGVEVEVGEGELSHHRRVGGLRMLPTHITDWHRQQHGEDFPFPRTLQTFTSYLPKSKPVEAAFDRMQTLEGTLWGNLGRDQMRRPNERAKKKFEACRRGAEDPREHFLSGTELLQRLLALYQFLNDEPMEGRVWRGVPRMLWEQGLREHPLFLMPEEQSFLFRRHWHATRITSGLARVKFTDGQGRLRTEFYTNPEFFARPGMEGRQVVVYFDHEQLDARAQVVDAASGEFLCGAEYRPPVGMFLDPDQSGHAERRRYQQAVRTHYAQIAAVAPSRQLPPEIAARRQEAGHGAAMPEAASPLSTVVNAPKAQRQNGRSPIHLASPAEFSAQAERLKRRQEQRQRLHDIARTEITDT